MENFTSDSLFLKAGSDLSFKPSNFLPGFIEKRKWMIVWSVKELSGSLQRYGDPEAFCKKVDVPKNFVRFIGKHLCLSSFFVKVEGWITAA